MLLRQPASNTATFQSYFMMQQQPRTHDATPTEDADGRILKIELSLYCDRLSCEGGWSGANAPLEAPTLHATRRETPHAAASSLALMIRFYSRSHRISAARCTCIGGHQNTQAAHFLGGEKGAMPPPSWITPTWKIFPSNVPAPRRSGGGFLRVTPRGWKDPKFRPQGPRFVEPRGFRLLAVLALRSEPNPKLTRRVYTLYGLDSLARNTPILKCSQVLDGAPPSTSRSR